LLLVNRHLSLVICHLEFGICYLEFLVCYYVHLGVLNRTCHPELVSGSKENSPFQPENAVWRDISIKQYNNIKHIHNRSDVFCYWSIVISHSSLVIRHLLFVIWNLGFGIWNLEFMTCYVVRLGGTI